MGIALSKQQKFRTRRIFPHCRVGIVTYSFVGQAEATTFLFVNSLRLNLGMFGMIVRKHRRMLTRHRGVVTVEMALTLPVFAIFLAALMEFGHLFLVSNTLNAAARSGARLGAVEGVTTAQVMSRANTILESAFPANKATVIVRDAAVYDTANMNAETINYDTLPAKDLATAKTGDLFLVQIKVPYNNVALLPPYWVKNRTITGMALMRHE